jgi:adenylylsulfate kinase
VVDTVTKHIQAVKLKRPWTLWITGLSGAGKTTISKELIRILGANSVTHKYLRLDEIRQFLTPNPTFTKEEREYVYRASIFNANSLNEFGVNVIIDSVDGQGAGRRLGREVIANFGVIYVKCPLEECIRREQHRTDRAEIVDLYQRALQGQLKLAGMGLEYHVEETPLVELDSLQYDADKSAEIIAELLE